MASSQPLDWLGTAILDGRLRIDQKIDESPYGLCFVGADLERGTPIVVRTLSAKHGRDPWLRQQFVAALQPLLGIQLPRLAQVLELHSVDGHPLAIVEKVGSGTLDIRRQALGVQQWNPMSPQGVVEWATGIADVLDQLHGLGLTHRDVRPATLWVDDLRQVSLGDLSLSTVIAAREELQGRNLSPTGMAIGVPEFMAPELILERHYSPAIDQYALGCTVFELLAGRPVFMGPSGATILLAQARDEAPSLCAINPQISAGIAEVVAKALAKRPEDRFQNCTDFIEHLAAAVWDRPPPEREFERRNSGRFSVPTDEDLALLNAAAADGTESAGADASNQSKSATAVSGRLPRSITAGDLTSKPDPKRFQRWLLSSVAAVGLIGIGGYWVYHTISQQATDAQFAQSAIQRRPRPPRDDDGDVAATTANTHPEANTANTTPAEPFARQLFRSIRAAAGDETRKERLARLLQDAKLSVEFAPSAANCSLDDIAMPLPENVNLSAALHSAINPSDQLQLLIDEANRTALVTADPAQDAKAQTGLKPVDLGAGLARRSLNERLAIAANLPVDLRGLAARGGAAARSPQPLPVNGSAQGMSERDGSAGGSPAASPNGAAPAEGAATQGGSQAEPSVANDTPSATDSTSPAAPAVPGASQSSGDAPNSTGANAPEVPGPQANPEPTAGPPGGDATPTGGEQPAVPSNGNPTASDVAAAGSSSGATAATAQTMDPAFANADPGDRFIVGELLPVVASNLRVEFALDADALSAAKLDLSTLPVDNLGRVATAESILEAIQQQHPQLQLVIDESTGRLVATTTDHPSANETSSWTSALSAAREAESLKLEASSAADRAGGAGVPPTTAGGGPAGTVASGLPPWSAAVGVTGAERQIVVDLEHPTLRNHREMASEISGNRLQQPKPVTLYLAKNSLGMDFVLLPPGTFWQGSAPLAQDPDEEPDPLSEPRPDEFPEHEVQFRSPLWMSQSEVTLGQYRAVTGTVPAGAQSRAVGAVGEAQADLVPVTDVTWFDAARFCNALSEREGLAPIYQLKPAQRPKKSKQPARINVSILAGNGYRLPTEAEWEFACRAGRPSIWHWDMETDDPANFAWIADNSEHHVLPVQGRQPNLWRLHGLHGNAAEWCQDWYAADAYHLADWSHPQGPATGDKRVYRGGSSRDTLDNLRSAARSAARPDSHSPWLGFRVVRLPDEAAPAQASR